MALLGVQYLICNYCTADVLKAISKADVLNFIHNRTATMPPLATSTAATCYFMFIKVSSGTDCLFQRFARVRVRNWTIGIACFWNRGLES